MASDSEIYASMGGDLVRFATVLIGPDEAPDVVSRVVARRLARGPLSELRDARQYMMRGIVNEAKNVRRSRNRRAAALERMGVPGEVRDIADGRYPDITGIVMSLPDRQRASVYLVYWMGLSVPEVARVLGCRPGTVGRYLTLARNKLREALDE